MNIAILKKCLEELNKKEFRQDYVIGMLETLIETQSQALPVAMSVPPQYTTPRSLSAGQPTDRLADEYSDIVNSYTNGQIAPV